MKMKQLISIVIALLLSAVILVSCSSDSNLISSANDDADTAKSQAKPLSEEECFTALNYDPFCNHSGNQYGYYEIRVQLDNPNALNTKASRFGNILFTDPETGKQTYLCSNPSCDHMDKTCTSWVNLSGYEVGPVALDDHLLLMYCASSEGKRPKIEIMDLDGSNRKTLYECDYNVELRNGCAYNSNSIFIHVIESEAAGTAYATGNNKLISIDLKTGHATELFSVKVDNDTEQSKSFFLLGTSKKGFVYKTITTYSLSVSADEFNKLPPEEQIRLSEKGMVHDYFVLPYDGSDPIYLFSHTMDEGEFKYLGNSIYYIPSHTDDPYLYRYNCDTCDKEVIFESVKKAFAENGIKPADNVHYYKPWQYCDNYLFIVDYREEYSEEKGLWGGLSNQYMINLETNEITKTGLYNDYGYDGDGFTVEPVYIWDQFDKTLLVSASIDVKNHYYIHNFGLITVDDYVNSVPNYHIVEMLEQSFPSVRK